MLIKGDLKKKELFQVEFGPDGRPQKTLLEPHDSASHEPSWGRIKEKRTEEFEDSVNQVVALAQRYAEPEAGRLEKLLQQGDVMIGAGGAPNVIWVVIQNYEKQGDYVALTFDRAEEAIRNIEALSYMNDPSDAVKITEQFAPLRDEPNHLSQMVIDKANRQLTIEIRDFDYQKMAPLRWPELPKERYDVRAVNGPPP